MTCPASSTAVVSLLPVPKRMPSNSALESASGPSDNSRSRGLSSGGSCFIVYLRVPTAVFYIIQTIGISTLQHSASACRHFRLGALQHSRVSGLDGFGWTCGRGVFSSQPGSCYLQKAPGWPLEALRTQGQPGAQPILERSNLKNAPLRNRCSSGRTARGRMLLAVSYASRTTPSSACQWVYSRPRP